MRCTGRASLPGGAAIDEIFTEDCVFYDPTRGPYRGRDEIDHVAGAIKATHPDFRYQPIAEPEELGNAGRLQWVSGRPGEAPAYAGTDFISTSYPELDFAALRPSFGRSLVNSFLRHQ